MYRISNRPKSVERNPQPHTIKGAVITPTIGTMMTARTASRTANEIRSGTSSDEGNSVLGPATGNSVISIMAGDWIMSVLISQVFST